MQWIAYYKGGGFLREFNPDGSENSFYDIDKERLSRFYLLGPAISAGFTIDDGIFYSNGKPVTATYHVGDRELRLYGQGPHNDIIQYKHAVAEIDVSKAVGETRGRILSYNIGWKKQLKFDELSIYVTLIMTLPAEGKASLYVRLVPSEAITGELIFRHGEHIKSIEASMDANRGGEIRWEL